MRCEILDGAYRGYRWVERGIFLDDAKSMSGVLTFKVKCRGKLGRKYGKSVRIGRAKVDDRMTWVKWLGLIEQEINTG